MKLSDIPFNMNFEVSDNLREYPVAPLEMKKGLDFLLDKLTQDGLSDLKCATLHGLIGVYARILGDYTEAEKNTVCAINIFKKYGGQEHILKNNIRLGVIFQWNKNYTKSDKIFIDSISEIKKSSDDKCKKILDMAIMNLGKSKFEQEFFNDALKYFLETLELKIIKGDLASISLVEAAIAKCRVKTSPS